MEIKEEAICGTLESNDLFVKVAPQAKLEVVINSEVMSQFGVQIRKVVEETLNEMGVSKGLVVIDDKGALDCTIKARVQGAVLRGSECQEPDWRLL